jgi:hypothetical protein
MKLLKAKAGLVAGVLKQLALPKYKAQVAAAVYHFL